MADHPSNRVTLQNLANVFTYHPPTAAQRLDYEAIRKAAMDFSLVLLSRVPDCADRSAAIRHVREAVMSANAAIALEVK
jgi:hypothetical protein